jgi:signal transduction histidine kinase
MAGDSQGWWQLAIGIKARIAAAAAAIGLLLCVALGFAVHKHTASVRANAQAGADREDMLAAERAVAAFWQEREVMGEILAFPHRSLADELRHKELRFRQALEKIATESPAELANVERAKAANQNLLAVFDEQPVLPNSAVEDRQAARLQAAERSVLGPVEELKASNRRDNLRGERAADTAERATFHTELATAGFGFAAVAAFALFAWRQVRRIDDQNIELQSADAAKDEFISTISHELRTPLTSINGYVDLLLDDGSDPLTEEQRGFLATVQRGSTRLERLIDDLLVAAQIRSGHLHIQKTTTDLVEIARQAVESAQTRAQQKLLELSLTTPSHAILIDADVVRMGQAIDNLISNAVKFTPEKGHVDLALVQNGARVTLSVTDTGMGMTRADIERLFERFFRTDSAQAQQIQGTGLGLPIVKGIIEAHDGTISVTSEPDVRTSFVISLPLARPRGHEAVDGQQERYAAA